MPVHAPLAAARLHAWRRVRRLTLVLLLLWGVVIFALPLVAGPIDGWLGGGYPYMYWIVAEGALAFFVALIAVYAWAMDRVEAELAARAAAGDGPGHA